MPVNTRGVLDALKSHAEALGPFERVLRHEPKNAPGDGLTCCIYMMSLEPTNSSGLRESSGLMVAGVRAQHPMLTDPQDDIDVVVSDAVDGLINAYAGNFTLGGLVRCVDLRGMAGQRLRVDYGYMKHGDTLYRFGEIAVPLIVNDCWTEAP